MSNGSQMRFSFPPCCWHFDCLWGRADAQPQTQRLLITNNKICAVQVTPVRKYTDQLCIHSRVSLILLLRNPYGIVYFWKWPHTYTHEPNIHGRRRSARSTSRPQSPCYSQNDDVTTAISIADLEPGYLKPTRQLLCKSLFGPLSHPAFTPTNKTSRRNK